jgi:hypothetical protein
MNVVSSHAAYALYPDATFVRRVSLPLSNDSKTEEVARTKYKNRGWTYINAVSPLEASSTSSRLGRSFVAGSRWVGDKQTWIIPFTGSIASKDLTRLNGWRLAYKSISYGVNEFKVVESSRLRRRITVNPAIAKVLTQWLVKISPELEW